MILNVHEKSGQSAIEFVALAVFVMLSAIVFYPHIRNHMAGRWHLVGDALSFGMVYQEESGSKNCSYESEYNIWYDNDCFQTKNCDLACFSSVPPLIPGGSPSNQPVDRCKLCLQSCASAC